MSGPTDERAAAEPARKWAIAFVAVLLAVAGVAVSLLGQHLGRAFLEERAGPALTLLGAGLWVAARVFGRRR